MYIETWESVYNSSFFPTKHSSSKFTLIDDSGADQSMINLNLFLALKYTGVSYNIDGTTSRMQTNITLKLVNNAYTLVILLDRYKVVLIQNQDFCDIDPTQTKSLLLAH